MSKPKHPCVCGNRECERIPYPAGERWLCGVCGCEYFDYDAASYRERQRKSLHKLLERLNNKETEQ